MRFPLPSTFIATVLTCLLLSAVHADPTPQRSLLALSKVDHTLSIIDPATLKIVAKVPVGPDSHEVIASPDGKIAYVSNTGLGAFHQIDIIDLVNQKALPSFDTAPLFGPHGLAFVDGKVWFTAQGSKALARYNPATAKVDWIMGTGQDTTHLLHVTPDARRIYTTNVGSGTVSIFENLLVQPTMPPTGVLPPGAKARMDWVQTLVPVGEGAEGFDVSPDEKELWTVTPQGSLSIIDLSTKKMAATIDTQLLGAHRLGFTPSGERVLIVSVRTGDLVVYDVHSRKEIKKFNVGHGAAMLMDPTGERAFISCTPDNSVSIVDLKTLELSGRLDVGGRPDGMAWAIQR
ncbi:YncE family protein [bacterium]|nr:MAG: YncE family protein [bacterium]